ncbi:tetratricopeptide repeat protein [candidate division KSB1 bacterium]|nr:tetratricopeptide repeat protein [candidate division KSB1 bacterium]
MKRSISTVARILLAMLCIAIVLQCAQKAKEIPITTSSEEALSLFLEGQRLSENANFSEAREVLKKALEKDPDFAMAHFYLAYASETNSDFFQQMEKSASLVDHVSEGEKLFILASHATSLGNNIKANEMLERLATLYPSDKTVYNQIGINYWTQNNLEKSVEAYKTAIKIDPEYPSPYNMIGYAYSNLGKYDEAEKALKTYAQLIPNEPNPWDSYGEILMKQGKFDKSIVAYQKAIDLDPHFVIAYRGLCMNHVFKDQANEGRKQLVKLEELAQTDGDRYTALHTEALTYLCEGKYKAALSAKEKCIAVDEKQNDSLGKTNDLINIGTLYLFIGKVDQAEKFFDKAKKVIVNSDHSKDLKDEMLQNILFYRVEVALQKKDMETAKDKAAQYKKLTDENQNRTEIQAASRLMGMIALHEKRYDDAIAAFEQTNEQNPRNFCGMAKAYMGKKDKAKANEYWEKAANFNDMSWNYALIRAKAMKMASK